MSGPNDGMKPSDVGIALIKRFEGFCAKVYTCPAGKPTIGYGHVVKPDERFGTLTEAQATDLLRADADIAAHSIKRFISTRLSQNQFDVLVSFTFNLGGGALETSTLRGLINAGRFDSVPRELNRWVFSKGQRLPGLIARRAAEGQLFCAL